MKYYNHWGRRNTRGQQTDARYLSVSGPGQGGALRRLRLAVGADHFLSQLVNDDLTLKILKTINQTQFER